jgi:hypothetical protein
VREAGLATGDRRVVTIKMFEVMFDVLMFNVCKVRGTARVACCECR